MDVEKVGGEMIVVRNESEVSSSLDVWNERIVGCAEDDVCIWLCLSCFVWHWCRFALS